MHGGRAKGAESGFTLIELLVVIAIIAILAALLFPTISAAKSRAKRVTCMSNLHQINLGVRMYADDSGDASPGPDLAAAKAKNMVPLYAGYKHLMKSYVGLKGASSAQDTLFACPADTFYPSFMTPKTVLVASYVRQSLHAQTNYDYSSYLLSGGDNVPRTFGTTNKFTATMYGMSGMRLSSVKHPTRTVLLAEAAGFCPWSWHDPKWPDLRYEALTYNDAQAMLSFVDGHVSYTKIYWNPARHPNGAFSFSVEYDPPAGYDYQWSGD